MRKWLIILAALISVPASAQVTANLPVTCNASGTNCVQATPMVNPNGTTIGTSASPTYAKRPGPLYTYNAAGYAAYATPTDMVTLTAPADRRLTVQIFSMNVVATAASLQTIYVELRNAASTGGTSTSPTPQKLDSASAAAGGVIRVYSTAPSGLGTVLNTVAIVRASIPASTGAASGFGIGSVFASVPTTTTQDVLILNPGETLALNFAGAALPAGFSGQITLCWEEETV